MSVSTRSTYALGIDFGTSSARALIAECRGGAAAGSGTAPYAHGENGVVSRAGDPLFARQHPADYDTALRDAVRAAIAAASQVSGFDARRIVGIGIDATASTTLPLGGDLRPLGLSHEFATDSSALAWLWKDHTAHAEAEEITRLAATRLPEHLERCGGAYSSEWYLAKLLACVRRSPAVAAAAAAWVELGDYIVALLAGATDRASLPRNTCAAGHKGFHHDAKGDPPLAFLRELDPRLADWWQARPRRDPQPAGVPAGRLAPHWARVLGLAPGVPVSAAAIDAHMGAVGAGVRPGVLVKVLGTSGCDLMVHPALPGVPPPLVPGLCGVVRDSIVPGCWGLEAGQAAVGDLFDWFVRELGSGRSHDELTSRAAGLAPGASGLLALDWNNGNRSLLADPTLSGLLVGQTLGTGAHDVYRALIEATAFGARTILEEVVRHGVAVEEIVVCGGIAEKNPFLLQVYADILGRSLLVSGSHETCALGAAMCGAAAAGSTAGGHDDLAAAQRSMSSVPSARFVPDARAAEVYNEIFALYRDLHDAFGRSAPSSAGSLHSVMKRLRALQARCSGAS